jgi:hypothetical protein
MTKKGQPCRAMAVKHGLCYQHGITAEADRRWPKVSPPSNISQPPRPNAHPTSSADRPTSEVYPVGRLLRRLGYMGLASLVCTWAITSVVNPEVLQYAGKTFSVLFFASLGSILVGCLVPEPRPPARVEAGPRRVTQLGPSVSKKVEPVALRSPATRARTPAPTGGRRGLLPPPGECPSRTRSLRRAWEHQPRQGVFVVHIIAERRTLVLEEFDSLHAAVQRWSEIALPVQGGWLAQVIDSNLAVVLEYANPGTPEYEEFPDGIWGGCRAGHDALRALGTVNEIDLAIWEAIAQRTD